MNWKLSLPFHLTVTVTPATEPQEGKAFVVPDRMIGLDWGN